ncbi:MAG: SH3 domain-containing protein [Acidobacteria bacterium]|nr:SH3 domain-containing protein [Acidobacteriota bacterium]
MAAEDPLPKKHGESGSERLFRLARAYSEDYAGYQKKLNKDFKRLVDPFGDLRRSVDTFSAIRKQLKPMQPFFERERAIAVTSTGTLGIRPNLRAITEATELSTRPLFEQHRLIAEQLADRSSPLSTLQDTLRSSSLASELVRKLDLGPVFSDRAAWAKLVGVQLGLGIAPDVIASLTQTTSHPSAIAAAGVAAQAAALFRPGFRSAASLALEGVTGRGVTADLLRDYDNADAERAPFFASVIESVAAFDDPDASETERASALQRLIVAFDLIRAYLKAEYQKAGLIEALALVVAVYAALPAQVPSPPPPPIELRQAAQQIKAMGDELKAQRGDADEQLSRIRYVGAPVNLRAEPHRGGLLIRIVYPDQWVQVLEAKGDWARVEVFDYRSDSGVEGWLNRRYLRVRPE